VAAYDENIDDEDIDEELDALFGDNTSIGGIYEEFRTIPDDEEETDSAETVDAQKHCATIPLWLKTDYADVRERLIAEIKMCLES